MFTDERNKKKEEKTRGAKLQNLISIKKRRALNKQHAKNAKLLTRLDCTARGISYRIWLS